MSSSPHCLALPESDRPSPSHPSLSLDECVTHIHTTNHAWKLSQHWVSEVSEAFAPLAASLVDRKARLQTELLRKHPDRVYLQRDPDAETQAGEPLFGVLLDPPIEHFSDAAHLPVRVARLYLSVDELQKFVRELPIPEPIPKSSSELNIDPSPEPSPKLIADSLEPLPEKGSESVIEPEPESVADVPEPVPEFIPEPEPDTSIDVAPAAESSAP